MKKTFVILLFLMNLMFGCEILAHSSFLNVDYDQCEVTEGIKDGYDEIWYSNFTGILQDLEDLTIQKYFLHIGENVETLRYYFEDASVNDENLTWSTGIDSSLAEEIKQSYANSMKKWNDVYYYSYNNGVKVARKVINVQEGTKDEHDISIYPTNSNYTNSTAKSYVDVSYDPTATLVVSDSVVHKHYTNWIMEVNVDDFHTSQGEDENVVSNNRERTGAHEMGHVLGLGDMDGQPYNEYDLNIGWHHEEVIMGYDSPRQTEITYKDIAGVSITRGFHTDSDHVWMLRTNSDRTKDVICSLCNGVRYDIDTTINSQGKECYENKEVNIYKSCTHYNGSNSNMLLVATNGEQDFYKCQYCRHIETVEVYNEINLPTNNSSISTDDNIDAGETLYFKLNVTTSNTYQINITSDNSVEFDLFDENFNVVDCYESSNSKTSLLSGGESYYLRVKFSDQEDTGSVITTISRHTHSNIYTWLDYSNHRESCSCGCSSIQGHAITNEDYNSGNLYATCIICGGEAMVGFIEMNGNNVLRTENGSFILSNGVIVLVDDDIEGYLNGTLIFRNNDEDIM